MDSHKSAEHRFSSGPDESGLGYHRAEFLRAREALAHVGARVLGAVVNDVREKGDRYGRYGYTGEYKRTPDELKQLPPGKMAG